MKKLLKLLPIVFVVCIVFTSVLAISSFEDLTSEPVEISPAPFAQPLAKTISLLLRIFVIALAPAIFFIVVNWKLYVKAGEPGWASIIPVYTNVVQFKIVGLSPWLLLLYLVPFVNYVAIVVLSILVSFRLAKSFGKDIAWGFGILLLPYVFYPILALGSSEYMGPNGETKF